MALIERMKGRRVKQSPSGYTRLFGNAELGNLMSRIQAAVISSGTELEKLIWERVNKINDLDLFISQTIENPKEGIWVANKNQIKISKYIKSKHDPDFLVFDLTKRLGYPFELKDGDQFDTKKSDSEYDTLHNFCNDISRALPLHLRIYICCFNAQNKDEIYNGLKHRFSMNEVLTGKDLCSLLGISYNDIIQARVNDQTHNFEYFIDNLLKIDEARNFIVKRLEGERAIPNHIQTPPTELLELKEAQDEKP